MALVDSDAPAPVFPRPAPDLPARVGGRLVDRKNLVNTEIRVLSHFPGAALYIAMNALEGVAPGLVSASTRRRLVKTCSAEVCTP
jgi:hypothetical protein